MRTLSLKKNTASMDASAPRLPGLSAERAPARLAFTFPQLKIRTNLTYARIYLDLLTKHVQKRKSFLGFIGARDLLIFMVNSAYTPDSHSPRWGKKTISFDYHLSNPRRSEMIQVKVNRRRRRWDMNQ